MAVGTVYLVGAGPGDPKLLTVGGKEALSIADVVVYDRLVHPTLLLHSPAAAERIYVGKQADRHTLTQDMINDLLSTSALTGKTVVRLKGGDPFVFGRGGEEAEHLRALNIPFVIIPGITSAIAAPAYAGIPVTHRDASSSFAVITGHERAETRESGGREAGEAEERRRWDKIANAADTLVFLMGVESLPEITSRLIENGKSPSTPVALVRWGTWAGRQETLVGELGTIAETVRLAGFKAPAVTIIGDVVNWRSRLQWFDNRPLSGKRIMVTRTREQSSGLVEILIAEGAEPVEFPTIKITEPADEYLGLDQALANLANFDWIAFTSANAVAAVFGRLLVQGKDSRALAGLKVASVGPATSDSLRLYGISPDHQPSKFVGAEVASDFPEPPAGLRILVPRAKEGNERLAEAFSSLGASVTIATAYETQIEDKFVGEAVQQLTSGDIDLVTFTSSSTVKNFFKSLADSTVAVKDLKFACIGPSTADTARELFGRDPDVLAEEHTIPGLVAALKLYFTGAS